MFGWIFTGGVVEMGWPVAWFFMTIFMFATEFDLPSNKLHWRLFVLCAMYIGEYNECSPGVETAILPFANVCSCHTSPQCLRRN